MERLVEEQKLNCSNVEDVCYKLFDVDDLNDSIKVNTFVSKLPTCALQFNKRKLLTSLQKTSELSCSESTPIETVHIVNPNNKHAKIDEKTSSVTNPINDATSLNKQTQLNYGVNERDKLVKSQTRSKRVHRVKLNNIHSVESSQPTVRDDNVETLPEIHGASNIENQTLNDITLKGFSTENTMEKTKELVNNKLKKNEGLVKPTCGITNDASLKDQNFNDLVIDATYCNKNHEKQNSKGDCCEILLRQSNTKDNIVPNNPIKSIPEQSEKKTLTYIDILNSIDFESFKVNTSSQNNLLKIKSTPGKVSVSKDQGTFCTTSNANEVITVNSENLLKSAAARIGTNLGMNIVLEPKKQIDVSSKLAESLNNSIIVDKRCRNTTEEQSTKKLIKHLNNPLKRRKVSLNDDELNLPVKSKRKHTMKEKLRNGEFSSINSFHEKLFDLSFKEDKENPQTVNRSIPRKKMVKEDFPREMLFEETAGNILIQSEYNHLYNDDMKANEELNNFSTILPRK